MIHLTIYIPEKHVTEKIPTFFKQLKGIFPSNLGNFRFSASIDITCFIVDKVIDDHKNKKCEIHFGALVAMATEKFCVCEKNIHQFSPSECFVYGGFR